MIVLTACLANAFFGVFQQCTPTQVTIPRSELESDLLTSSLLQRPADSGEVYQASESLQEVSLLVEWPNTMVL